ncbi:hypothetical protein [Longimicrobium terrae]|uniref:Uncharacterized protein n=1 Tax=Longimicrobium terrae TaxID=1639882 RepID=A0A841H1J0_9BACT|nr:hypothetical protein [Longimicrobium terrae]MBB4637588.1 hypothetical protein [Longimicrobium terrae]MBB6071985.1 hypothetical protein [Longimicrobium terrae]NNC30529.1 hypothetical protein [Longimicrobium terrae]
MRRASLFILPLLAALAACGDDPERSTDGEAAEEHASDPMRMESDPADSIAEAKRMQAHSDSVRREVMRKAGLPEEPPEPPEVPARPAIRNKAECLAQADSVGGGEGEVLRSACRNLPDAR